jgi:hypothetical protein
MQHRLKQRLNQPGATSIRLYALGAIFLVPLSIGVLLVTSAASQNDNANQISHDIASMYAQGVDFSQRANQNIALSVADGKGVDVRGGKGVVILSKIRVVHSSDCAGSAAGKCGNKGYAVVTQRYVLGSPALRASSFGTPASLDQGSGEVRDWANDPSARAADFTANLRPGEFTYVAECFLTSPESGNGVYSRTMF